MSIRWRSDEEMRAIMQRARPAPPAPIRVRNMKEHPLRDLARRIEQLAKDHEAYSQAYRVVQNCCDHLSAIARTHEANVLLAGLAQPVEQGHCRPTVGGSNPSPGSNVSIGYECRLEQTEDGVVQRDIKITDDGAGQ